MLRTLIKSSFSSMKTFTSLEHLNKYLNENRPAQHVVYFRANWNPQCEKSDQHISQFASDHPGMEIIKIDSDAAPKIAKHYNVKS